MNRAGTLPISPEVKLGYQDGESTYYLAYRVPLHFLTQFDQSFAQEVVNSGVFLKEPKVDTGK